MNTSDPPAWRTRRPPATFRYGAPAASEEMASICLFQASEPSSPFD